MSQLTYCVGCRIFHRPPLHEQRGQSGFKHGEAFCLMTYASKDRKIVELVWNSRDGVTPFTIPPRDFKGPGTFDDMLSHIDWHRDIRLPDYKPQPGERYFADLTPERARHFAERWADRFWDDPKYPLRGRYESREEAIQAHLRDEAKDGAPDLVEVPRG